MAENIAQRHQKAYLERIGGEESVLEVSAPQRPSKAKIVGHYLFDHTLEQTHFEHRLDAKEGIYQPIGLVAYGFIGAVDAVVDSVFYFLGEMAEDVSFGSSRIIFRIQDGWKRGRTGTGHE